MKVNVKVYASVLLGLALTASQEARAERPDGAVESSNTHAMVRVESTYTNTIISVPWTFYTPTGSSDTNLPIDRLVCPTNLTLGDRILALLPDGENGTKYAAWELVRLDEAVPGIENPDPENNEHWCRAWVPVMTSERVGDDVGRSKVFFPENSETNTACRGYGVWLYRQNPMDTDGKARPFYLYGQLTTESATVKIPAAVVKDEKVVSTSVILANPDCSQETDVNDGNMLGVFDGSIGDGDTLIITTNDKVSFYCYRMQGKWQYSRQELVNINANKFKSDGTPKPEKWVVSTVYKDPPKVPAGTGFWYVRRTTSELTLEWNPEKASPKSGN